MIWVVPDDTVDEEDVDEEDVETSNSSLIVDDFTELVDSSKLWVEGVVSEFSVEDEVDGPS